MGTRTGRVTIRFLLLALVGLVLAAPFSGSCAAAATTAYTVEPGKSQLLIYVYRDGALAQLGHNHVISTTALNGEVHWDGDVAAAAVTLAFPVASLEVDDAALRAAAGADFESHPDQQAIAGTRANMLGASLLDAAGFSQISLTSRKIEGRFPDLTLTLEIRVRDHSSAVVVPVHAILIGDTLTATGKVAIQQTALGLKPFRALIGALRVKDQMDISFRIVARRHLP